MRLRTADESRALVLELLRADVSLSRMANILGVRETFLWKMSIGMRQLSDKQYWLLMDAFGRLREMRDGQMVE